MAKMGKLSERVKLGMAWLGLAAVAIAPVACTAYKSSEHKKAEQAKQAQVAVIHDNPIEPAIEQIIEPVMGPLEVCIEGLKAEDGFEFAKHKSKDLQFLIDEFGAKFCKLEAGKPLPENCPVNRDYLSDLGMALDFVKQYAGLDIAVHVLYADAPRYDPHFNTYINGHLILDSRLLEKIDGIAAAFSYKASHEDFDIIKHFKEMEHESWSRKPIKMPPGEYDNTFHRNARRAIIAYIFGHEAGHVMQKDVERLVCGENINIYYAEELADRFAVEFVSAMRGELVRAAPLLFWKFDEVNGYEPKECKKNANAYSPDKHPCASFRYGYLRNQLLKLGIDTSQIDSIFETLQ